MNNDKVLAQKVANVIDGLIASTNFESDDARANARQNAIFLINELHQALTEHSGEAVVAAASEPDQDSDETITWRFFKDLNTAERMKVLKVFGIIPADFSDFIQQPIMNKLFGKILEHRGIPPAPVTPVGDEPYARLVSYALDGSTCTLNMAGTEMYFDRASMPVKDGWMPIETAPKDGTEIIIGKYVADDCNGEHGESRWYWITQGSFDESGDFWEMFNDEQIEAKHMIYYREPTHWMPRPSPPTALSTVQDQS